MQSIGLTKEKIIELHNGLTIDSAFAVGKRTDGTFVILRLESGRIVRHRTGTIIQGTFSTYDAARQAVSQIREA